MVVGLTVAGLVAALVLPVALDGLNEPQSTTIDQEVGDTDVLTGELNATLDSVDDTAGSESATATVTNTDTGDSSQVSVDEGTNSSVTVGGVDVTVTTEEVTGSSNATMTYEYPRTSGWSGGAAAIFGILDLILILVLFMVAIGWALMVYNG